LKILVILELLVPVNKARFSGSFGRFCGRRIFIF